MENQEPDFITIGEIFNKAKRRKWTLIFCVVLSVALAFLYNRMAIPIYRASAIISFERFSNDNMLEFDFSNAGYKDNFIANRIMELKTVTFAQNVFHTLPDSFGRLFRLPDSKPMGFDTERYIITGIQDNILIEQNKSSPNLLTISFDSENVELATEVTNTAIDVLRKRNLSYRREEFTSLKKFIDEQIQVMELKLDAAEDTLSNFKSSNNIASLADESREILTRITQAEILYNQIQTDKKAAEKKLSVIEQRIDEQKENISSSVPETSNPMIAKLKEQLIELEVQAASLHVQGYSEDHPRRQELNSEIDIVKQNLTKLTMGVIQDQNLKGMIDPLSSLKSYLEESIAIEIEIEALLAQQNHLQGTLRAYNKRLKSLSANDATLFDLHRGREVNNKLYVRLLEEREQARLREAAEIGTMRVIEEAITPFIPYKPRKKLNIIIAVLGGFAIGLLLIFVKESLNDVPHGQEEVEAMLNLPVLASIPKINHKSTVSLNGSSKTGGRFLPLYKDSYSYLWHCVHALSSDRGKIKSVMVTSARPGEGKSTVASNLAITAAKLGKKTLLIEGDLRKPTLAKLLNAPNSNGSSDYFSAETEFQDLHVEGLKFLSAGSLPKEPGLFWASPKLKEALNYLMEDFDFVVIDSPPVLGIPDAVNIASYVDGIILCVEAEKTPKKLTLRAKKILKQTNNNLLGIVWNKAYPIDIYGKYGYDEYYKSS